METQRKCLKCNAGILSDRVKRGILVRALLFWLPVRRYRCGRCGKKTYILSSEHSHRHHSHAHFIHPG